MKTVPKKMPVKELVLNFAENCVKQYEADLSDEISKYNDLSS